MLEPSLVRDVLDAALATGGDFAELFMEDRRDTSLVLQLNRLETVNSGRIHGAGVRVYVGLNAIYAYTNDTSREGLIACARQAASAVRERGRELAACAELTLSPVGDAHPVKLLPSRTDTRRKADILRAANARRARGRGGNRAGGVHLPRQRAGRAHRQQRGPLRDRPARVHAPWMSGGWRATARKTSPALRAPAR